MLARVLAIHPSLFVFNQYPSLRTEAFVNWSDPGRVGSIERKIKKKRGELITMVRRNRFIYVENSTSAPFLMDELYRLFDAKFICLYRDGRDFVRSGMSREWYKPESFKRRLKTWIRRRFLIDIGQPTVDTLLIPPRNLKTRFEKIAWRWTEVNRIMLDRLSLLPDDRKLSICVEKLDRQCLVDIHNFMGIHLDDALLEEMLKIANTKPNKTSQYTFPLYTDWSQWEKERFSEIAGDMMQTLGYKI